MAVKSRVHVKPLQSFKHSLISEWRFNQHAKAELGYTDESKGYLILSWLASFATMLHIISGMVLLSSALFISPRDAVLISVRFFGSAVVCRLFVMVELHVKGFEGTSR